MRTFKYKNKKFSEFIETNLTNEEQSILDSDIGYNINTLNVGLMQQKMNIQNRIQLNENSVISDTDMLLLNSVFNKIQTDIGDTYEITNMIINYDDIGYTCNVMYRLKPSQKNKTYIIPNEELL